MSEVCRDVYRVLRVSEWIAKGETQKWSSKWMLVGRLCSALIFQRVVKYFVVICNLPQLNTPQKTAIWTGCIASGWMAVSVWLILRLYTSSLSMSNQLAMERFFFKAARGQKGSVTLSPSGFWKLWQTEREVAGGGIPCKSVSAGFNCFWGLQTCAVGSPVHKWYSFYRPAVLVTPHVAVFPWVSTRGQQSNSQLNCVACNSVVLMVWL